MESEGLGGRGRPVWRYWHFSDSGGDRGQRGRGVPGPDRPALLAAVGIVLRKVHGGLGDRSRSGEAALLRNERGAGSQIHERRWRMKLPEMKDEAFLRLAREEDNCSISAGSMQGVFRKKGGPAAQAFVPTLVDESAG